MKASKTRWLWKALVIFAWLMVGYHLLHTFLVYGIDLASPFSFAMAKDLLWVALFLTVLTVLSSKKILQKSWSRESLFPWLYGTLAILIVWSLFISYFSQTTLSSALVGFKYDIWPLIVIAMALIIGQLLATTYRRNKKINWTRFLHYLVIAIIFIVLGGFLWQFLKITLPGLFESFGYGAVGDYILGSSPPIWYRTGPGGMMRWQGLFAGPNNYGYFLVGVFPIVAAALWKRRSKLHWIGLFLVVLAAFFTLSRGALLGIIAQCVLLALLLLPKKHTKRVVGGGVLGLMALMIMSFGQVKKASTIGHFEARGEGVDALIEKPLGYGLGASGPSVHFDGVYLPENQYLQIGLDVGLPGLFLWLAFWLVLFFLVWKRYHDIASNQNSALLSEHDSKKILLLGSSLGVVGLLIVGLFLHSLEDSMVNYLVLGLFGLICGMLYALPDFPSASDKERLNNSLDVGNKENK